MKKSIFFLKELTDAEVGNTKTHEVYIRLPNDFDYEVFFHNGASENGTVIDYSFVATNLTFGYNTQVQLKFVYYVNSNREKRIPSLSSLFSDYFVNKGDIVCLESRQEGGNVAYYIRFYKKGDIIINPSSIYYTCVDDEDDASISNTTDQDSSHQQIIYFGAPGTSKSTTIKRKIGNATQHRITFHPDTDYSNFVGCYKPTMANKGTKLLDEVDLGRILKDYELLSPYRYNRFGGRYWRSLESLSLPLKDFCVKYGMKESDVKEVANGIAAAKETCLDLDENEITYDFVPQVFIKAYVDAWKKKVDDSDEHKEVYLIIEEINRGNCAQIFGDLFQLLDRDDEGYSDYTIEPDSDLQRHLAKMFKGTNVPENIRDGIEMQLPPNMFIWATMNTSDQSLFPIDSAFKRRWEWKYLPIKDDHKGHIIRVDEQHAYDWWLFLEAINLRIEKLTELEDKQLGYWFAKPNKGKEISAERFVSKVVFYLWNDVFKDYGNDGNSPFNIKQGDDKRLRLKFTSFFDPEGNVMPDKVITFIEALGVPVNTGAAVPLTEGQQAPPDEQDEAFGELEATPDEQPEAPEQHVVEESPVAYGSNQPASSPEPDDDDDDDDDEPEDEGGDMNDLLNELYPQK